MWAMVVLLFDIDFICEMGSCPWNDFFGPRRDPVHGRKCAKGASLHRNCISMSEMAARGPVFRGAGLRYGIDVVSYQAKRIPCREPLAFF